MKSRVKVYILEEAVEACRGWNTPCVEDVCEVISPEAASKVLGVVAEGQLSEQFEKAMGGVVFLHKSVEESRDAAVEAWDKNIRESLGRTLNGELSDH